MLKRRSSLLGGTGAMLLVLSLSGVVAGATLLTDAPALEPEVLVDTTATFEDLDGNGVDDDCQETVEADADAALAAEMAVDVDGDGVISTTEAANSDRTGGANCNHGGYVSTVAQDNDADEVVEPVVDPAECVSVPAPEREPILVPSPQDHGTWVSTVAGSLATGGKNCNHGGAVSEATKADLEAAAAAREAAKAARAEARELAKAERDAAREARQAERQAARDARPDKAKGRNR